jgi:hypothetical protein
MSIASLYPTIEPELNLDFSNAGRLDPRITFSRNSIGTYTDAQGMIRTAAVNEPRFDHDPVTGECLGLLVEESRQNLLLRSEEFDNASWTVFAGSKTVTPNVVTSPSGTLTADTVTADGTSAAHFVDQLVTLSAVSYTLSVYAKAGTNSYIQFRSSTALGSRFANFDLSLGVTGTSTNITSSSIESAGNGWYRCSMVFTPTAATGTLAILLVTASNSGSGQVNTLDTSVHLWGAQLEVGSFPTSYIPTGGVAVTRNADLASVNGARFSSWYLQSQGTFLCEIQKSSPIGVSRFPRLWEVSDNTINNVIRSQRYGAGTYRANVVSNGTTYAAFDASPSVAEGSAGSFVMSHSLDDIAICVNGGVVANDNSSLIPSVTQLNIGDAGLGAASGATTNINGSISRLIYWPARLSNAVLQSLTR